MEFYNINAKRHHVDSVITADIKVRKWYPSATLIENGTQNCLWFLNVRSMDEILVAEAWLSKDETFWNLKIISPEGRRSKKWEPFDKDLEPLF